MVGLETAASIAQLVLIDSGESNWQRMAEVLAHKPAEIGRDANQGESIVVGSTANLVLIDAGAERNIAPTNTSKSQNNPYAGLKLPGVVVHTIYRGEFTVKNSKLQRMEQK
jgi:dihydroorotase